MRVFTGIAVVLSAVAAPLAGAQPAIDVGSHDLLPDTPGQTIEVYVTGGQPIVGTNLNVQIADGLNTAGPVFQGVDQVLENIIGTTYGVDAITGTLFDAPNNNGGQDNSYIGPQVIAAVVVTPQNTTVAADGLLATLTIDTTGVFAGTYDLKLAGTRNGDTDLNLDSQNNPIEPTITNGQINIIPEPASALLLAAGGGVLIARRRRRC